MFIDADGRPRIGDFDVSVDVSTRSTIACATATATINIAGTLGYMAPEVLNRSKSCSTTTDVFAYGATLNMVMVHVLQSADAELLALIKVLTATDPCARPTAAALVDHAYFAADLQWRRQELRECVVCFDEDIPLEGGGLECSDVGVRHFTCSGCLARMVGTYANDDVGTLKQRQCKVPCPGHTHTHPVYFSDSDLAQRIPVEIFDRHISAQKKVLEEQIARELETEMQQRMKVELAQLLAMDEESRTIRAAANAIREDVLTLKCPRDGQAFLDFDGCLALKCPRCPCHFCGWCLSDCGDDAHAHIRACADKPVAAQNDPYFAPMDVFDRHWQQRRRELVLVQLQALDAAVRSGVERELRQDLLDLGIQAVRGHHGEEDTDAQIAAALESSDSD